MGVFCTLQGRRMQISLCLPDRLAMLLMSHSLVSQSNYIQPTMQTANIPGNLGNGPLESGFIAWAQCYRLDKQEPNSKHIVSCIASVHLLLLSWPLLHLLLLWSCIVPNRKLVLVILRFSYKAVHSHLWAKTCTPKAQTLTEPLASFRFVFVWRVVQFLFSFIMMWRASCSQRRVFFLSLSMAQYRDPHMISTGA